MTITRAACGNDGMDEVDEDVDVETNMNVDNYVKDEVDKDKYMDKGTSCNLICEVCILGIFSFFSSEGFPNIKLMNWYNNFQEVDL